MSQVVLVVKKLSANARDIKDGGLILGSGRSPGGGNGNPLQYSCPEYPMDRRAWWAVVHGVTKSQTRLKRLGRHKRMHIRSVAYERQAFYLTTISTKANECICTYAWRSFLVCYCPGTGSLLSFHFCIKLSGDTYWHPQYLWFINWLS